jgi:multidrug resistance protein
MASAVMELVDTSAVNVSLPYIAGNLSASVDEATWVLTSYLVANAVILPLSGWLANYFGRKRLLMLSVAGFTGASILCGLAPTLPALVLFRVLQGAAGGVLQPTTRAIMLEAFPREERGHAMALWGVGIVIAPIVAPMLGGWLTTDYSWRWIFFINLPISLVGLFLVSTYVFDPPYIRRTSTRIDYWGMGFLAVGIASLQIVFDKGQEDDWFGSHFIVAMTLIAVPRGIATLAMMPIAGFLIGKRWDMRALLSGGLVVSSIGAYMFSYLNLHAGPWSFFWPQMVMGAGLSFMFVTLATITVDPIPQQEMGYATSLIGLARNLGAGIGISVFTALIARREQFHQVRLAASTVREHTPLPGMLAGLQGYLQQQGGSSGPAKHQALVLIYHRIVQSASALSYLDGFRIMSFLLLATVPFVWIMKKPHFKSGGNGSH